MLQETANLQSDSIKSRLESIKTQADVVCQLSAERLQQLEAAQPLATHYSENQTEISAWLDEMEAEMNAQGSPGENLEQVKKQHDNLRVRTLNLFFFMRVKLFLSVIFCLFQETANSLRVRTLHLFIKGETIT